MPRRYTTPEVPPSGGDRDPRNSVVMCTRDELRELIADAVAEALREVGPLGDRADERMLTPRDVAERLQCTRRHVYNLIEEGRLPAVRVGGPIRGHLLVAASELELLLSEGRR